MCCRSHVCRVFWNFHSVRFLDQLQRQKHELSHIDLIVVFNILCCFIAHSVCLEHRRASGAGPRRRTPEIYSWTLTQETDLKRRVEAFEAESVSRSQNHWTTHFPQCNVCQQPSFSQCPKFATKVWTPDEVVSYF